MTRIAKSLLLLSGLSLGAQDSLTWATEVDLLPVATGGWYASIAAGRHTWRLRAVAAEVNVPDAFAPEGWRGASTRAQALLLDRFFRSTFTGPWIGAGLECWDEALEWKQGPQRVRLKSLQATLGAGWVFPIGRGFCVNPWLAVHQRISGDRSATQGPAECRPGPLQAEASIKIGYSF